MKRLLLVGAGHAHAQVLRAWARGPRRDVALTLVSPSALAPYSGMVPGWLAGHYSFDEICIDFAALCAAAGARLLLDEAVALDADRRRLQLAGGGTLDYEVLSLNIGSTLRPPAVPGARVLPMRPLGALRSAWDLTLQALPDAASGAPLRLTAVGGGAAGVESLLAVRHRLRERLPLRAVHPRLVSRGADLLPGAAPGAVRRLRRALDAAQVTLQLGRADSDSLLAGSDLVLWATGAQAHPWPAAGGLAVDGAGFVRVDTGLRSVSHPGVFAAGDCAAWLQPLPKSGVVAVRMGPVLWRNLQAALGLARRTVFAPQPRQLALLATGERRAVASWGRWSAEGAWVWRWKDHIDRGFVRGFVRG